MSVSHLQVEFVQCHGEVNSMQVCNRGMTKVLVRGPIDITALRSAVRDGLFKKPSGRLPRGADKRHVAEGCGLEFPASVSAYRKIRDGLFRAELFYKDGANIVEINDGVTISVVKADQPEYSHLLFSFQIHTLSSHVGEHPVYIRLEVDARDGDKLISPLNIGPLTVTSRPPEPPKERGLKRILDIVRDIQRDVKHLRAAANVPVVQGYEFPAPPPPMPVWAPDPEDHDGYSSPEHVY